jgi:hypothetical protein
MLSLAFGAKDLHYVFSSKCRFFVACWLLRMTVLMSFSTSLNARRGSNVKVPG